MWIVHAYLIYCLSGCEHWQSAVWRRPCEMVLRERESSREREFSYGFGFLRFKRGYIIVQRYCFFISNYAKIWWLSVFWHTCDKKSYFLKNLKLIFWIFFLGDQKCLYLSWSWWILIYLMAAFWALFRNGYFLCII